MRSINRYSGSPVRVEMSNMDGGRRNSLDELNSGGVGVSVQKSSFLLGINWGSIPAKYPVLKDDCHGNPQHTGQYIKTETNMACVVPAWKIKEVLECDAFASKRESMDDARRAVAERHTNVAAETNDE